MEMAQKDESFKLTTVDGGVLIQNKDIGSVDEGSVEVVTDRAPTEEELQNLLFLGKQLNT